LASGCYSLLSSRVFVLVARVVSGPCLELTLAAATRVSPYPSLAANPTPPSRKIPFFYLESQSNPVHPAHRAERKGEFKTQSPATLPIGPRNENRGVG